MTTLTRPEVLAWCTTRGLVLDQWDSPTYGAVLASIEIPFPNTPYRAPYLADLCYGILRDISPVGPILFWVKETRIGSDYMDGIGLRNLELLRTALSETRPLIDTPGHLFTVEEKADCIGMSVLSILYGWDAFLILDSGDAFVYISHDEYAQIRFRDPALIPRFLDMCQRWDAKQIPSNS